MKNIRRILEYKVSMSNILVFLFTMFSIYLFYLSVNQNTTLSKSILSEADQVKTKKEIKNVITSSTTLYKVIEVVDGDTIKIMIRNELATLRLIGIDTPETKDPRKPVQCFGKEASKKAVELLSGKSVYVESDPTQGEIDKYGRLLRFVFFEDGTSYQEKMIKDGYGNEYTYNLPYKYMETYKEAQAYARMNKLGLWAENTCAGNTKQAEK